MKYFLASLKTLSYWRYSLFSTGALVRILSITGGIYLLLEMLDFFNMYTRDQHGPYSIFVVLAVSIVIGVATRRPVSRVTYKILKRDFSYEVVVGDLLDTECHNVVISTNATFDTDVASGLIAPGSLQGQLAHRFFNSNTAEIDRQIDLSLRGTRSAKHPTGPGKKKKYPIGTVAKLHEHGKTFFLLAMSELNEHGNARSNVSMIDAALDKLWTYIAEKGELGDVAIPVLGTGRGRIRLSRKKMIERIAQSFADASKERVFCNRLVIYVHPDDAAEHGVNLFEVRDYLSQSLHI
ncbi:MAG: hypothetical protein E5X53_25985 [Mesorhizobium sp.]|uniref:macro domain-containing protein n=1 Tax=Mesorhizobium sp. TaxID=1871066 RepID=UPI0011F6EF2B|nr:macro domain-containing protein [Mesorhizobium sp.]TIR49086.1 MAG: hypothetical protein E5X53_25985 [Mesorhizobium sp.]